MIGASHDEAGPVEYIDRCHTPLMYIFILSSVSMCITVDILQYSMPLAFLPSVLEDRGHSPEMIATAIGVYYWTGLLGGLCLTSYEVWRLLYQKEHSDVGITPYLTVCRQIKVIIVSLSIGVVTLFVQAHEPRWHVHTTCRFIQGFVGAFLFFYVFLLNVAIFAGQQMVIAMSFASCATVLAELAGPLLGSILFDIYGQRVVFWCLGVVSFTNIGMLFAVLYLIKGTTDVPSAPPSRTCTPMLAGTDPDEAAGAPKSRWGYWKPVDGSVAKLQTLFRNPTFICATLIITMAGVIKGSVEEMLPFHADHQWGYDPVQIGKLFCTTAVAYFVGSSLVAVLWTGLGRFQTSFSAHCILLLGISAWMSFHVAFYYKDETALYGTFASYGFCAGLAFTCAAQLIAEVVENAQGHTKGAANGLWNTMWEFGGSTGFFLGGFLAHHYHEQMRLVSWFLGCSCLVFVLMLLAGSTLEKPAGKKDKMGDKLFDYGTTA